MVGKDWNFPAVKRAALGSGSTTLLVSAPTMPIVEIRAVIRAGSGFGPPGLAELTAELLRDGGTGALTSAKTLERLESLGANLSVDVDFDATTFGLAVTADRADAAIRLLGDILQKPRFDEAEFKRLRDRKVDQAEEAVRSGGSLVAMRVAMRELFAGPYANGVATGTDFSKVSSASVREFYAKYYGSKNLSLVLAGAVEAPAIAQAVDAAFGHPFGGAAPPAVTSSALPPKPLHVIVCDRPSSVQSDVFVVSLAPERHVDSWPALRVANQTLGGGVASRLFDDVREARGLAYAVRSQIVELAQGPELFTVYAGTQTAKTAETVGLLLEHVAKLKSGFTADEVTSSSHFLHDVFAVRVDGVGALADLAASAEILKLGDGYWDAYRTGLLRVTPELATNAAATLSALDHGLVVVSGDARALEASLARFADVTVVSPEQDFQVLRTVPKR